MLLEDYILYIVENQSAQEDGSEVPFKSSVPDGTICYILSFWLPYNMLLYWGRFLESRITLS